MRAGHLGLWTPSDVSCRSATILFCQTGRSRSVMLYVIDKANHPNLAWRGGQGPIVHIEADLREVVT